MEHVLKVSVPFRFLSEFPWPSPRFGTHSKEISRMRRTPSDFCVNVEYLYIYNNVYNAFLLKRNLSKMDKLPFYARKGIVGHKHQPNCPETEC